MKFLLFILLQFIISSVTISTELNLPQPDWRLVGPGDADQVTSISILSNNDVIIGTDIGGLYISSNNGTSWKPLNNGLNNLDITTKVIQDPVDASTLFVGTRGGLYKSSDYGQNWVNIRNGLPDLEHYKLSGPIGSIAINPHDENNMLLGIGYRPSYDGTNTVRKTPGSKYIYLSNDKGNNWKKYNSLPPKTKISKIAFSPIKKNTLYAATNNGLLMSQTLGESWSVIYPEAVHDVLPDKLDDSVIYAVVGKHGVLKSSDGGQSWTTIDNGLKKFNYLSKFENRYSIITSDANQGTLYTINSTWGASGGLYKSDNNGKSWDMITNSMPESWLKTSSRMNDVSVSPGDNNTLYVGSSRYIYSSNNKGHSWKQHISRSINGGWTNTGINVFGQTRTIVMDAVDKNILYIGTADHKMLKSKDYGKSWNLLHKDENDANYVWDIAQCKLKESTLHIITSDNSKNICTMKSDDQGVSWEKNCSIDAKAIWKEKIRVSPFDCKIIIAIAQGSLYISFDKGNNWKSVSIDNNNHIVRSIEFDKRIRDVIYAGTSKGLYISKDAGASWSLMKKTSKLHITSIHLPKADNGVIFIGTEISRNSTASIYKSSDNGRTWSPVLTNLRKYVSAITSLPGNSNAVYAATLDDNYHDNSKGSGIFRSIDGGITWHRIDHDLPVHRAYDISTSPLRPFDVFLATNGSGAYIANEEVIFDILSR